MKNSPIKWSGSKKSQAKEIISFFPNKIKTYHECFLGGNNILYDLLSSDIKIENIELSDIDNNLMTLWLTIKLEPNKLSEHYNELWSKFNNSSSNLIQNRKDFFYETKENFNKNPNSYDFLFLMRTCFNGLIRYNKKGEFNTSCHFTRPGIEPSKLSKLIFEWSELLKKHEVNINCCSYEKITPKEGDFVYFDPPYHKANSMYQGNFVFEEFLKWMNELKCGFALSYDGKRGNSDLTQNIIFNKEYQHYYIKSGNSSFSRLKGDNKVDVYESLYIIKK
jgi:DNA adenine methylase